MRRFPVGRSLVLAGLAIALSITVGSLADAGFGHRRHLDPGCAAPADPGCSAFEPACAVEPSCGLEPDCGAESCCPTNPSGPAGTQSYAVILWHEAPDQVKSYWIVYDIPADVTSLARGSRGVGTTGLNDKRRAEYDPMCSKGPGAKTYHLTVYAVSARPRISAATRATLLDAIRDLTLAEGTLTFTYDRGAGR